MTHKFIIKKHPINKDRQSCLLIDLFNPDNPLYLYVCYLSVTQKFFFAFQTNETEKSSDWIQNVEIFIHPEILEFVKKYLRELEN